jgi:hypothetical protein
MSATMTKTVPTQAGWVRGWPRWAPYAALVWSLVYAALGLYWALSGHGFPYTSELASNVAGPVAGRFGPIVAWIIVFAEGIPAVAVGILMLRGVSRARPLLISAGVLLAGIPLLLMTDITLLILFGYIPYGFVGLITGAEISQIWQDWIQWPVLHQWLCVIGGFLWLAATVSYTRRSGDACPYCGRTDRSEGWKSPQQAAHWGRIAVYLSPVVPIFYALTRYAWALGIPLGISEEYLRNGQESGLWTSGLFLATFGLLGAALTLGLVRRWGEVFPRWMIGLAGRQVPIALAVVPASIVSVLLVVGGISIWSGYAQMADVAVTSGQNMAIVVGPTMLFPVWGAAIAVATLGYYYRRRGPCGRCGRGSPSEAAKSSIRHNFVNHIL